MSHVITAIFEDGVFKPLQDVQIKEHEKVEIKILAHDEWQKRFNRIIAKIHKKASKYSPNEIESDITQAIKEVREKKRAC
ncbi:MAG: antitoxin family protein [Nitrospirae bacterium]|nr:antitoxin family protein [Nitrospirota bacterium]MBI3352133.1 antitoxin family protein [Nitrospirota bacterium]